MAYPAVGKTTWKTTTSIFSFLPLQLFTSVYQQENALERFCSDVALGARRRMSFYATNRFRE